MMDDKNDAIDENDKHIGMTTSSNIAQQIDSQLISDFEPDPKSEITTLENASYDYVGQSQIEKVIDDVDKLGGCQQTIDQGHTENEQIELIKSELTEEPEYSKQDVKQHEGGAPQSQENYEQQTEVNTGQQKIMEASLNDISDLIPSDLIDDESKCDQPSVLGTVTENDESAKAAKTVEPETNLEQEQERKPTPAPQQESEQNSETKRKPDQIEDLEPLPDLSRLEPEPLAELEIEPEHTTKHETESKEEPTPKQDPEPEQIMPEPETTPEPMPELESTSEQKPVSVSEPEPKSISEPEPKPPSEPEPKQDQNLKATSRRVSGRRAASRQSSKADTEASVEPKLEPEPKPEYDLAPESDNKVISRRVSSRRTARQILKSGTETTAEPDSEPESKAVEIETKPDEDGEKDDGDEEDTKEEPTPAQRKKRQVRVERPSKRIKIQLKAPQKHHEVSKAELEVSPLKSEATKLPSREPTRAKSRATIATSAPSKGRFDSTEDKRYNCECGFKIDSINTYVYHKTKVCKGNQIRPDIDRGVKQLQSPKGNKKRYSK